MGVGNAWEPLLERSISAYYEGRLAEGRLACDRLLCVPDLPANVRAVTRTNQAHYAQHIGEIAASYQEPVISRAEFPEPAWGGSWAERRPDAAALQRALALLNRGNALDQERWLSVVIDGALYVMASLGPTAVVRRDATTGGLALAAFHDAPFMARDLHGGSQLVATDDGFLALVYDVVTWEEGNQTYLHRFVRFDHAFQMTHLSHPFRLQGAGVAVACGLAREGAALALAYRVDRDCHVGSLELSEAMTLLQPIALLAPRGAHPFAMPQDLLRALQQWDRPELPGVNPVDPAHISSLRPETVIEAMHGHPRS